ncbi:hypothetical protein FCIRC_2056 [Fusarium circinatum]|uniref:Uncharacterized protein n=1 Tax=Fusarium circinatum TaxID=48490 RepID=A0A8H5X5H6_FUSCI|nr:hypothetical protein FCIRC_2056 [Fusarium circinatum]
MSSIDDVRWAFERLDSLSKALAEAKQTSHEMGDSDYSVAYRDRLDKLYERSGDVYELLGAGADDISDWRNLPAYVAQGYLFSLQKELRDLLPADHPKAKYFICEAEVLRYIAMWETTLLRGFLTWAVVEAHKPSSDVRSLLQMHFSDDAEKYLKPKPKGHMKVVLVRVTDLPKLVDHWDQRVISGPGEEEMVEVCGSEKSNFRRYVAKGLFVLAWKVPGDYEDMWMDGQGFAIPDVPELI